METTQLKITGRNFVYAYNQPNGLGSSLYIIKFFDRITGEFSKFEVGWGSSTGRHSEFVDTASDALDVLWGYWRQAIQYGLKFTPPSLLQESDLEAAQLKTK